MYAWFATVSECPWIICHCICTLIRYLPLYRWHMCATCHCIFIPVCRLPLYSWHVYVACHCIRDSGYGLPLYAPVSPLCEVVAVFMQRVNWGTGERASIPSRRHLSLWRWRRMRFRCALGARRAGEGLAKLRDVREFDFERLGAESGCR